MCAPPAETVHYNGIIILCSTSVLSQRMSFLRIQNDDRFSNELGKKVAEHYLRTCRAFLLTYSRTGKKGLKSVARIKDKFALRGFRTRACSWFYVAKIYESAGGRGSDGLPKLVSGDETYGTNWCLHCACSRTHRI